MRWRNDMKKMKRHIFIFLSLTFTIFLLFNNLSSQQTAGELFEKALYLEEAKGDLQKAIDLYEKILEQFPDNREIAAQAQLHLGLCYEKLGLKKAQNAYQKVVENYPEQKEAVKVAKEKLTVLISAKALIEKGDKELKIRQIWSGQGVDILGAASPDGKFLCFTDWNTGDLTIRDLSNGENRHLTNKGSWLKSQEFALFSEWAPDSKHIVYNWCDGKEGFYELHTIGVDGSKPKVLYRDKEVPYVQAFDWSPDGRSILAGFFNLENNEIQIGLITIEDGSIQIIKTFKTKYARTSPPWGFNFSPDGSYIAYDFMPGKSTQDRDIYLLLADGSREIPLIKHPALDYVLEWTPDGRGLLFASERTGSRGVWFIPVKEGKPQGTPELIKDNIGPIEPMGCTAKGDLFYGFSGEISDIYTTKIDPNTGQILTPPKKEILNYEGHNYYPDYSPDGKKLAYMFLRGGLPFHQNTLCIVSLETREKKELNPSLRQFGYPRWSPDGNSISLEGIEEEGHWGIFRIDVQTGEYVPVVVCENEDDIYSHRWSVDGKAIFYTRGNWEAKTSFIFVHDFETGQDSKLSGTPSDAKDIDISPDGKSLVLLNREDKRVLKTIPTAGGEPRELYSFKQDGNFILTPAWTANGRFILFPKRLLQTGQAAQEMQWDIWRIPVEGGEPQRLDLTMFQIRHLSVHPDGHHLAFSSIGSVKKFPEVWVMENFLPKEKSK